MKCWFPLLFFFSFSELKIMVNILSRLLWCYVVCCPPLPWGRTWHPCWHGLLMIGTCCSPFICWTKCVSIWSCVGCDWWLRNFLYAISLAESIRQVVSVSGTWIPSSCVCELWWLGNPSTQPRRLCRRLRAEYNFVLHIQLNGFEDIDGSNHQHLLCAEEKM